MDDQSNMIIIWAVLAAVAIISEMFTLAFFGLYIGLGAAASSGAAALSWGFPAQVGVFCVVTIVLLLLTRPLIMKRLDKPPTRESNVDNIVGRSAIVTIDIDNDSSTGQVRVGTEFWTARSTNNGAPIAKDVKVTVDKVEGVTAWVTPMQA